MRSNILFPGRYNGLISGSLRSSTKGPRLNFLGWDVC